MNNLKKIVPKGFLKTLHLLSDVIIYIFLHNVTKGTRSKSIRVQNPTDQNPPSQIREPLTD